METGQAEEETTRAESDRVLRGQHRRESDERAQFGERGGPPQLFVHPVGAQFGRAGPHLEDSSLSPFGQQLPQLEVGALDGVHSTDFRGLGS